MNTSTPDNSSSNNTASNNNNNNNNDNKKNPTNSMIGSEPPEYPDPDSIAAIVAKQLSGLSVQEKKEVQQDIHGRVPEGSAEEDPDIVVECLYKFQHELDNIAHKPAYDLGMAQSPEYIAGEQLWLMFLRAKEYDPKQAATTLVSFLELKRYFFGDDKVGRPIRYVDLLPDDLECLKQGWFQVLPFRDRAGRAIMWFVDNKKVFKEAINAIRAGWYRSMVLMEDEETQKNGIVIVISGMEDIDHSKHVRELIWLGTKLECYLPMKIVACHFYINDKKALPVASLVQMGARKELRARILIHQAADTEMRYSLMKYGIPVLHAPITYIGELKVKYHRQWLKRRWNLEIKWDTASTPYETQQRIQFGPVEIDVPNNSDILLGKGIPFQHHPGNLKYQEYVDAFKSEYEKAGKHEKRAIINTMYKKLVQDMNMRFLQQNGEGWWAAASPQAVYDKISHRLRLKRAPTIQAKAAAKSSPSPTPPG